MAEVLEAAVSRIVASAATDLSTFVTNSAFCGVGSVCCYPGSVLIGSLRIVSGFDPYLLPDEPPLDGGKGAELGVW